MKKNCAIILLLLAALCARSAELTNSVGVTTNLTFYLRGSGSNEAPQSVFRSDEMIYRMLIGTSTNLVFFRLAPKEQAYEFHLFDKNGLEVKKSELGIRNSSRASSPQGEQEVKLFNPTFVNNSNGNFFQLFRPEDMFVMTQDGDYEMEIRMRICVPMANGLPDVERMLDSRRFFPAQTLGILNSSPLRVKVVKRQH